MNFSFSDTISGYVTHFDSARKVFGIKTSDGREFEVAITPTSYGQILRNLDEPFQPCPHSLENMFAPGQFVHAYGIFYPDGKGKLMEGKMFIFSGEKPGVYRCEEPDWWVKQVNSIARSYLKWQFNHPSEPINYHNYRTFLHLGGAKKGDYLQETDTISRLIYGMASAYMLTGNEDFLEAAEKGTEYLREHMRFVDTDNDIVYWYHGIKVSGDREQKLLTSEFGDDYDSIPAYEQIYALAGPVQTYRLTGDPRILSDANKTIELFQRYFIDREKGGYFSNIDPINLDPRSPTLDKGNNRAKKNWNSVGDHAPAYLVNLWLATGDKAHAAFLEETFDTIEAHFPDYEHSPFVQEKFFEDWSKDQTWGWQQNRGLAGHNLKIAWNLMRMNSLKRKGKYEKLARKIAKLMPKVGMDKQRGGWYDAVERVLGPEEKQHRFVWHDRKAWWQQEQGVLAYLILKGVLGDDEYMKYARESSSFYNAFFLDHDDGAVYFNVLANGMPYLLGTERFKGSHSMSAYHSTEIGYLAAVYTNLLITGTPMNFHFKPRPDGFRDRILRVSPDILPKGRVKLTAVEIDGKPYSNFDAEALSVKLPDSQSSLKVKVTITPCKAQS
ncbi:MAG: AGE family epimerase/isomerase [Kiritimatiellae bacterium]|nr:AGE family epimerase/isomerase [Kiritimatiellia bacterium]